MPTYKVTFDSPDFKLDITCNEIGLKVDTPIVSQTVKAARDLHAAVPMGILTVVKDVATTNEYRYSMTAIDGRKWKQRFRMDAADALMNFNIDDYWRLTEFIIHRNLRDLLIAILWSYNVENITVDWK